MHQIHQMYLIHPDLVIGIVLCMNICRCKSASLKKIEEGCVI